MSDEAYAKECLAADEKVIDAVLVECAPASPGEIVGNLASAPTLRAKGSLASAISTYT